MSNPVIDSAYDQQWRQFLYNYYTQEWEKHNGNISLEDIYPIAKKKYKALHKQCDIDLVLMANKRKHKKV